MRAWKIGVAFAAQYLKGVLAFRWDFWLNVSGLVMGQAVSLLTIHVMFARIPHLQGWSYYQVLLIYGFSQLTLNLCYVFGASLGSVNQLVLDGQLDPFLVRPVDPLFQLLAHDFGLQQVSAAMTSLGIVLYSLWHLPGPPWWSLALLPVLVTGGAAVYLGLGLIAASTAFWLQDRHGLVWPTIMAGDVVSQYPLTIHGAPVRFLVTWVLPVAFTSFYPATLLLGVRTWLGYAWATPLVGLGLCLAGYRLWRRGLRRYSSAGG
jgi:ABC-2 type transport system permease protein